MQERERTGTAPACTHASTLEPSQVTKISFGTRETLERNPIFSQVLTVFLDCLP